MYNTYGYQVSSSETSTWLIISVVVAVIGGITLFFTFLNPKNEKELTGFLKTAYDFLSFKVMLAESLLMITYLILAIYITLTSFALIGTSFPGFLVVLVAGNVVLRLSYEMILVMLKIFRNTTEINDKMPSKKVVIETAKKEE